MKLNDIELSTMVTKIKHHLENSSLMENLETTIKHIPTYEKIIKTHIGQLQTVLASNKHQNKSLETVELSPTVKQLMNIFDALQPNDLAILEELQLAAAAWQHPEADITAAASTVSETAL